MSGRRLYVLVLTPLVLTRCGGASDAAIVGPPAPRASETAVPTAPGIPTHAASLVGDSAEILTARLGHPTLRRAEGPAEFWLYAGPDGCRVDVVLYPEASATDSDHVERVAHVTASVPRGGEAACLRAIATGKIDGRHS